MTTSITIICQNYIPSIFLKKNFKSKLKKKKNLFINGIKTGDEEMRQSWVTLGSGKPQESSNNDPAFELSSIIRSFTNNPSKISRQRTFCYEPGPDKSLSDIVSRINNSVESNKSLSRDYLVCKNNNLAFDNEDEEMSRTESAITGLPSEKKDSNYLSSISSSLEANPDLIEIFSGKRNESVDQLTSSRSLSSRINESFDVMSARSSVSRNRISSTASINFDDELWPTSPKSLSTFDNSTTDISRLFSNSLNSRGLQQVAERLEDFIPTRDSSVETKKNLNISGTEVLSEKICSEPSENNSVDKNKNNDELKIQDRKIEIDVKKSGKFDQIKSRYSSGISGGLRACAKQSKMMIPQSKRLRALFQPMAGIQEPEVKVEVKKGTVDKSSRGKLTGSSQAPAWRPGGPKVHRTSNTENSIKSQSSKSLPFRPKTFITDTKTKPGFKKIEEEITKEESKKKFNRHSNSLKIIKEILSYEEEKEAKKKYKSSSDGSSKNSKTLLEKLAGLSESHSEASLSLDVDDKIKKEDVDLKILKIDIESQTSRKCEKSISLQTETTTDGQKSNVCTETELDESSLNKKNVVNTGTFCENIQSISSTFLEIKESRVVETQTSRTSLHFNHKEKRNASMETIKLRVKCKQVNTEKKIMIDTSSGTVATNEFQALKRDNTSQADAPKFLSIKPDKIYVHSSAMNLSSCEKLVSTFSRELQSSRKCLVECCEKFSSIIIEKQKELSEIPLDVIKAFELAAERAQNLHRAIEIYHQNLQEEMKNKKNTKINSEIFFFERPKDCWTVEDSSESLIADENLQKNMDKLVIQQEVQTITTNLLDQVEKLANKNSKNSLKKIDKNKKIISVNSGLMIDHQIDDYSLAREAILPVVYAAICVYVFWSLQFSFICEY